MDRNNADKLIVGDIVHDDYVIITPDDTCDNGSLILTHKPYTKKVNQNVVLKNS
jgi:hypothetical protein